MRRALLTMRYDRRALLAAGDVCVLLPACKLLESAVLPPDAVVGKGGFSSVQAALDAAPTQAMRPYRILIRRGRWREKLTLDKPNIHLVGEDRAASILDFDAAAGLTAPDGRKWGTFRSPSLTIAAPDCAMRNLTVRNSFDYVSARANPQDNPAGDGLQAVALAIMSGADRTLIENVDATSWQDTVLTNAGRSFFRNCRIEGAVDYIFGAGTAFFEQCVIVTRGRDGIDAQRQGYITAPSTLSDNPYGLVFDECRLEKSSGLKSHSIALGRPWHNSKQAVGQAVFLRCWMDDHIDPVGWDRMAYGRNPDGTYLWFTPEQARFFEFASRGPGGTATSERRQLTEQQATAFTRSNVLGGWDARPTT